jgi:hypothetical protein
MERNSSQTDSHSASHEIPDLLWNPKLHYRVYKCPSLHHILSQMNPVHIFKTNFFKVHFNNIVRSFGYLCLPNLSCHLAFRLKFCMHFDQYN